MWGKQDLGGGMSALFNLQNGFNVNTGKMSSALLVWRKAYVGWTGGFDTVTAGRQQDLVLPVQGDNFLEYFTALGDVDNADGSVRNSSAVKWVSPSWGGLQVAAMYGFGGVAGSVGAGQAYNAALSYTARQLTVAAGYTHLDNGNAPRIDAVLRATSRYRETTMSKIYRRLCYWNQRTPLEKSTNFNACIRDIFHFYNRRTSYFCI